MLNGKKIILGVTGSIAAYKAVFLLRLLKKSGAEVRVIMTKNARNFVSPLTFSTLSGERVVSGFFVDDQWENHALLGRWADLILIAPASAQTIAKMSAGFCDNLLLAVYLSAQCPVMIAPAMDEDMWLHPSTGRNIKNLETDGVQVLSVGEGQLASGLAGQGRLSEPGDILGEVENFFNRKGTMQGKRVLITAGPTIEPIDPVRYISNYSSGKMGIALATAFLNQAAAVTLVTGPIQQSVPHLAELIKVNTAAEMYDTCLGIFSAYDVVVMAAAVADYTPVVKSGQKIKKRNAVLHIDLEPTKDILLEMGRRKKEKQILVGFALETENGSQNALEKLAKKNADFIVLNVASDTNTAFGSDTNKISIFGKNNVEYHSVLKSKIDIAADIVAFLSSQL